MDDIKTLFNEHNHFSKFAGVEVVEVSPGRATCVMAIRDEHKNLFGTVNAGAIYTLAETAFGAAVNTHGSAAVAVNLTIAYLKPGRSGVLRAEAEELSAGNRMATYSVQVFDDADELIADVQATGYRTKSPLPDPAKEA